MKTRHTNPRAAGSRLKRRGVTLVESAFAMATFAILMAGIMELGLALLAANSITFAAERAARYASMCGRASGHPATAADIRNVAQSYTAPLSAGAVAVDVTWTPDNQPGSTVEVAVSFSFQPKILPLSSRALTLGSTSRHVIMQ